MIVPPDAKGLMLRVTDVSVDDKLSAKDFYGKAVKHFEARQTYAVHFTSVPPEIDGYFQALRQYALKP